MTEPDHYATLQVPADADAAEIRAAYLSLMRDTHPDLHPGDAGAAARAQQLNAAYSVLRSPSSRAQYDRVRAARRSAARNPASGSWTATMPGPGQEAAYARMTQAAGLGRQAYSRDQHEVRAAFHAASVRVGVALFVIGAVLLALTVP